MNCLVLTANSSEWELVHSKRSTLLTALLQHIHNYYCKAFLYFAGRSGTYLLTNNQNLKRVLHYRNDLKGTRICRTPFIISFCKMF